MPYAIHKTADGTYRLFNIHKRAYLPQRFRTRAKAKRAIRAIYASEGKR